MASPPHVLVFPFPIQGHINCLHHFATGLAAVGLLVTVLHTDHNLRRLGPAGSPSPRLRFLSVPDGLPDAHPRSTRAIGELMESLRTKCSVAYRALLASLRAPSADATDGFPPVTCVVADGLLPFGIDVPEELGVPAISFRTASACSFLAYLSVPKLLERGELPFAEGADLDEPVRGVPGMESFLRRRDLPSQCRNLATGQNPLLQTVIAVTARSRTARALVLNTSASLESSALAQIAPHMRDVFAVGPLHAMSPAPATATSLWHEDGGCMAWLDGQEDRSVVYVSLGSLAVITGQQFQELLAGLVATRYAFLWVLRPDTVEASGDGDAAALRVREAMRSAAESSGRARFVAWAPQRDVLRHRAVGCFLTHAGWNSTLEATVEGVPMVCWPLNVDQHINSRFVDAVWRTGLDMKDQCDRVTVESMVKEAMESTEMRGSAQALADQVRRDIAEGGSSATEFQRLPRFIKELSVSPLANAPLRQHV